MALTEKRKAYMKEYRKLEHVKRAAREYMAKRYQENPEKFRNIKLLEYHKKKGNITDEDIAQHGFEAIAIYKTKKHALLFSVTKS